MENIEKGAQPELRYGDLVWISFTVEFIIGAVAWNPTFIPVEVIRVGNVATELVGHRSTPEPAQGAGDAPPVRRQRLQAGQACLLSTLQDGGMSARFGLTSCDRFRFPNV